MELWNRLSVIRPRPDVYLHRAGELVVAPEGRERDGGARLGHQDSQGTD